MHLSGNEKEEQDVQWLVGSSGERTTRLESPFPDDGHFLRRFGSSGGVTLTAVSLVRRRYDHQISFRERKQKPENPLAVISCVADLT